MGYICIISAPAFILGFVVMVKNSNSFDWDFENFSSLKIFVQKMNQYHIQGRTRYIYIYLYFVRTFSNYILLSLCSLLFIIAVLK